MDLYLRVEVLVSRDSPEVASCRVEGQADNVVGKDGFAWRSSVEGSVQGTSLAY